VFSKSRLYVFLQILLFALFLFTPAIWTFRFGTYVVTGFKLLAFGGMALSIMAVLQMGNTLKVFPEPKEEGQLITSGFYRYSRHPIYTGLIIFFFGFSLASGSLSRVILSLSLLWLFHMKSRYEESLLQEKYPEYTLYQSKTGRFFPKF